MEIDLPEETIIIKDMVQKFVERELIPLEEELKDRKNSYEVWKGLKLVGLSCDTKRDLG